MKSILVPSLITGVESVWLLIPESWDVFQFRGVVYRLIDGEYWDRPKDVA